MNRTQLNIEVVHSMKTDHKTITFYCGRNKAKPRNWQIHAGVGNPHDLATYGRGTCIAMFDRDLMLGGLPHVTRFINNVAHRIMNGGWKKETPKLDKEGRVWIRLACHCAPQACHCDIIRQHILDRIPKA